MAEFKKLLLRLIHHPEEEMQLPTPLMLSRAKIQELSCGVQVAIGDLDTATMPAMRPVELHEDENPEQVRRFMQPDIFDYAVLWRPCCLVQRSDHFVAANGNVVLLDEILVLDGVKRLGAARNHAELDRSMAQILPVVVLLNPGIDEEHRFFWNLRSRGCRSRPRLRAA